MLGGVVDVVTVGPAFDAQYERLDAPVHVVVALEQVGVVDADEVVEVDVAVDVASFVQHWAR